MEYTLYALDRYNEKDQEYYHTYKPDQLVVQQKGMNIVVLADTSHSPNVVFFYELDGLYWKLNGIYEVDYELVR